MAEHYFRKVGMWVRFPLSAPIYTQMTNLLEEQNRLQEQAFAIIEKLNLKRILGTYGQCSVVGSAAYGLMTWRDIDVDVVMGNTPTDDEYWKIVKSLFSLPNVKLLTLVDDRRHTESDRPKSMYVGITYEDSESNTWKIDIRLLAEEFVMTDKVAQLIKETMDEESQNSILHIKSCVHDNPRYHKDFSSVDIYEAVLLSGAKDLAGFEKYLSQQGKSL